MTNKNRAAKQYSPASPYTSPPNAETISAVKGYHLCKAGGGEQGTDGAQGGVFRIAYSSQHGNFTLRFLLLGRSLQPKLH